MSNTSVLTINTPFDFVFNPRLSDVPNKPVYSYSTIGDLEAGKILLTGEILK